VALRAANNGVDAGDQLVLMERLGHVVVGAAGEGLHLGVDLGGTGKDHDRGVDLADPQRAQHVHAAHVRQVQVEQDEVVVVDLAQIDAFLAQVGSIDVEPFRLQHQLDALRRCAVVLNQQYAHQPLLSVPAMPREFNESAPSSPLTCRRVNLRLVNGWFRAPPNR
jgi:hypothetical protein